ncbi:MAG: polyamine transporter permease [Xanthobacteraceae bacterium]|jgi:ABC-type spermidine/putrescine transport system permease subunit II|nr:polyamine transporter permease [Xanthobacteraceae bacterium]MDF2809454.1 polyamine transporter permease [Microvirga sp.]
MTPSRTTGRSPALNLFLVIWCALVFGFLMAPLLIVFPISFSSASYLQFPPPGWSLRWYQAYLSDYAWMDATWRSVKVALATTVLSTVLGTMLAFSLVRGRYPGRAALGQVANTPLLVPTIIYSVAVYGLFAQMRLIGQWWGIVLAHTVLAIPYVTIMVSAALKTVDPRLEQAAIGLGASRLTAIRRVTLPIIRPAIISAMFLAFISSFDELVVAMFLGGVNMTLPKKMFDNIVNEIDPTIAAVSVLQILLVCVCLLLAKRFGMGGQKIGV